MKPLFTILLVFLCLNSMAQDYFRGLIGYSYSTINNNGTERKVNGPLYIIYNETFCQLSVNGVINNFKVGSYSKELNQGNIEESFISDETNTKPKGFYSITIVHNKAGKSQLTINMPLMPGGAAYFVSDARVYSENGRVKGHAHVQNWKELEKQSKYEDSIKLSQQVTSKAIANYDVQDYFNKHFPWSEEQLKHSSLGVIKCQLQIDETGKISFIKFNDGCDVKNPYDDQNSFIAKLRKTITDMPNWTTSKQKNGISRWCYVDIEIKLLPINVY